MAQLMDIRKMFGDKADISEFLFGEQIKFSVLQTLVLAESMVSSSSQTIYSLSGAGILMCWFFMFVVQDDVAKKSLHILYPALLMLSTSLLILIEILKVLYVHEQVDNSIIFLSVAILSDNMLMVREFLPTYCKHQVQNSGIPIYAVQTVQQRRTLLDFIFGLGYCIEDGAVGALLYLIAGIAIAIISINAIIVLPLYYVVKRFYVDPKFKVWVAAENASRSNSIVPKKLIEESTTQEFKNASRYVVGLLMCVIVVDFEFFAVAVTMALYSGGARVGGTAIGSDQNHFNSTC